jgi:integrase
MTTTLKAEEIEVTEKGYTYKTWNVSGYVNGKRVRIRCKNKSHAQMVLIREQTKGINSQRALEYLPTHLTKAQLDDCESVLEKLGNRATIGELFDFWHAHHATRGEAVTLAEAIRRYLGYAESRIRSNSWTKIKQSLNRFALFVGSESPVAEITHATVTRYLEALRAADGVQPASHKYWNNARTELHAFFGWTTARPQEYTVHNVVADVQTKKVEGKEIQILTADDSAKLMAHVQGLDGGKWAKHFALALFAGIRPEGELEKLQPADIDLTHNVIKIRAAVAKTGKTRQVTIQPNLRAWLERFADQPLNGISEHTYRKVKASHAKGHDVLRHSFCSNLIHVAGTFAETALESGNSEKILRSHYVNRVTKAESEKFWAIEPQ